MISTRLLNRIEEKKNRLDALRPLPVSALVKLKEQIMVEWIYNSNAIEGSTLNLQETRLILEAGITIGGKSLREHFEVINHKDAILYVENLVSSEELVTPFHVRQIHKLVLANIDSELAGKYRETQVRIIGASITPPESWQIPGLMAAWGDWLAADNGYHPIELAALAHHRLAAIHPFVDGNGRTARLVMNLILMRAGYPPTVIERINRQQYYQVLQLADQGKPVGLVNFVSRAVERSLQLYLDACLPVVTPSAPEEQWVPLRQAMEGTPYSQEYLSLLARTGKIEAVKRGKVWFTTRRAIEAYIRSVS